MKALIVLRVGYMERYDGPSTITNGGSSIEANGVGGEVFNFKPSRGRCYGYAMSLHFSGLNLRFIDKSRQWQEGDELSGVDVVFIARRPGFGQVVVGWYRNATVFHRQYRSRRGGIAGTDETSRRFLCDTHSEFATLLPENERTFEVPAAQAGNLGFIGRSNIWYPAHNAEHPAVNVFVRRLLKYISVTPKTDFAPDEVKTATKAGGKGRARFPDYAHNAAVELAAEEFAWAHYKTAGYSVKDVASECLGWDFFAKKRSRVLRVEVKGVSASTIYFELTPREYEKLQEHSSEYRVCVVCDALTSPRMFELLPERWEAGWRLVSKKPKVHVPLIQKVAAVGREVAMDEAQS